MEWTQGGGTQKVKFHLWRLGANPLVFNVTTYKKRTRMLSHHNGIKIDSVCVSFRIITHGKTDSYL